jgi:shikimate kinase/3-dehydroquinate synthase
VLVGFMGTGKSTLGPELAARLGRPFVSVDSLVEERTGSTVAELFAARGEASFRELEEAAAVDALSARVNSVVELGGGALGSEATRALLRRDTFVLYLETTVEQAWERVVGSDRPLAAEADRFRVLFEERKPVYEDAADGRAGSTDDAVLAAAGIRLGPHTGAQGDAIVADERVADLHAIDATHVVPAGESAKTLAQAERLWRALRVDRASTLVAVGGGTTTDLAGFVAATYLRGVPWIPVPSTLVGQVDAAIGGKTGVDLPQGKNLVGAFHWPMRTVIDTALLETLPEAELQNGAAEVVKTGLLAGEPLWELGLEEQVRRCAAFKAAVCLRDPLDRAERAQLNLGHTFAHALEAASGFALPHGHAVALGLLAALRLSGLEEEERIVQDVLSPEPAHVDSAAAWEALARDKKVEHGVPRLVLLDAPGRPRWGVQLDPRDVRSALGSVII